MTRDEFWQLVNSTRPKGVWAALHAGALEVQLETLPEEEIVSYAEHFFQVMAESYRYDLWGAAYIANGGCSDDGFEYFRAWLISQGKRFYDKCLANPDALASRASAEDPLEDEEFLDAPYEAYREKTGRELTLPPIERPSHPAGQRWEEAALPKLYPKLAKKFHLAP